MKIKAFLLAILVGATASLGVAPARADGFSVKLGYHHGGHYGHKRGYRKHGYHKRHRHWRRHRHGHYHPRWRPYYPKSRVYVYRHYYEAPSYYGNQNYYDLPRDQDPAYANVTPAPAPAPVVSAAPKEEYCREYTREVIVDGRPAQAYGRACRQPDGSWRIVSEE